MSQKSHFMMIIGLMHFCSCWLYSNRISNWFSFIVSISLHIHFVVNIVNIFICSPNAERLRRTKAIENLLRIAHNAMQRQQIFCIKNKNENPPEMQWKNFIETMNVPNINEEFRAMT